MKSCSLLQKSDYEILLLKNDFLAYMTRYSDDFRGGGVS